MNRERLKGHLDLLLMSVLAAGPAHGYAILAVVVVVGAFFVVLLIARPPVKRD